MLQSTENDLLGQKAFNKLVIALAELRDEHADTDAGQQHLIQRVNPSKQSLDVVVTDTFRSGTYG